MALPLTAPVVDLLAVFGAAVRHTTMPAQIWLGVLAVQYMTGMIAFRLDRNASARF